jgi:hypothetical protein
MAMPTWMNIALQVVGATLVIIILYVITLVVLNIDSIVVSNTGMEIKQRESTIIADGFAGPSFFYGVEYNTINPMVENYMKISRSANAQGGISFTYQMWVKVEDANDEYFKDLIILHKGDTTKYKVAYYQAAPSAASDTQTYKLQSQLPADSYIACPQIAFGQSYRDMIVKFNSNNNIVNEINITMDADAEPSSRKNLMSLLPVNWCLLTFVFEDHYSLVEGSENGIKFTFYINEMPYWSESPTSRPSFRNDYLKQNDGNLYMFPNLDVSSEFMKIGNIKYYNYALQQNEIRNTFLAGPPKYAAVRNEGEKAATIPMLSALNKLDVLNY